MWLFLITTVILGAVIYKLVLGRKNNFWKKLGVRFVDTSSVIGPFDVFLARRAMTEADDLAYEQMGSTDKFCGIMEGSIPILIVKDMDLIKKVLIKDFDHFVDRRKFFSEEDGSLNKTLLSLEGDEWKGVRASVSPTFTTGKIRRMMESFNEVGKEWVDEFKRKAKASAGGSAIIEDGILAVNQYTVEVISTNVFGMSAGVIRDPNSKFAKHANRISDFNKFQVLKFILRLNFPKIGRLLRLSIIVPESMGFFERILDQGLQSRLKGETKRNDFLQLLVEAKKGELKAAGNDELSSFEKEAQISENLPKKQYLTNEIMNAQSVVFFFAGFSTTSNFITFALYALALNPNVQERLRKEVEKIAKEDGSFDYDDIGQLVYMDMVMNEVLRKFPAVPRLERVCVRDYKDPESGLVIPKGTVIGIPVNAIHHDIKYYDNPYNFDPENFSPEKKAARNPYAFMPFGMGPRNCIGMRFAQIEVKSAMAHMVHNFIIEPTVKTPRPLHGQPAGLQLIPPKKLQLKLTPISKA